ncbi:MAG TPA: acyl-CoA dehydrogenase family protein [Marmoricola sp.]|jgi:hypothetical protein|nr:acyl-CoA dehydrogenase family protein [Marmoricola sp.]
MHFARTEEQDELASTVRGLLAKRSDSAAVRAAIESVDGYDTGLWEALCEQIGVAALAVPEEYEGFGASLIETGVVLEELGRNLAPTPLLPCTLAAIAIGVFGSDEARTNLLPRLAAGELGALDLGGPPTLGAADADVLLAVRGDELVLLEGATIEPAQGMDQTLRFGRISAGTAIVIGTVDDTRTLSAISQSLTSALQVGAIARALEMTVAYSKERVQFGRTIGSFQALKHRMADMLVLQEAARSASWGATAAAAAYLGAPGMETADRLVQLGAVAGSYCSDALDKVAGEAVQLHGGIAITWEHDIQLVFKRAHALSQLNGPAHRQRAAVLG